MKKLPLLVLLVACHAAPAPLDGAGHPASCASACAALSWLGCPEGAADAGCVSACEHVEAARLTDFHVACVSSATTVTAVRKCGSVRCGQ